MTIIPENSTFAQTKYVTNLSTILKKNVVIIRKHFKRKASSIEEEPKRILSSASKHLMYILTSHHHPLQTKIKDLFKTYNTNRNKSNEHENTKNVLDTKEETFTEEQKDHGIGSNMTEQGMHEGNDYVPHLLNVSVLENRPAPTQINTKQRAKQAYERFENPPDLNSQTSHMKYVVPKRI